VADLSLVPTDDLLDTLRQRFDHLIFAGVLITGTSVDQHMESWHGHAVWCQGLATDIIRTIQDAARQPED